MLEALLAKLKPRSRGGARPDRASIVVPFLIIAVGLAMLAWRSYQLSEKMERGANSLAVQYAGYASEITARRVDTSLRTLLSGASEAWQAIERRTPSPSAVALQGWINDNSWIVSALYVPDSDPANSIYISELQTDRGAPRLAREFYTSSGTVRYMYDPERLLEKVHSAIRQQPLVRTSDPFTVQQRADLTLIRNPHEGLLKLTDGFSFVTKLSPPLQMYGIRAVVRPSYIGSGWENQGVMSLALSIVALSLAGVGALLTFRGLRKEAEMVNLRGALIANVSHELRTPLSMIRLGAETLQRGGAKLREHEREQIEDQILRESMHLSHLVENVLDVARMQHGQSKVLAFTPVHPRDLVRTVISTYESWIRSKGFNVSMQLDETIEEQLWDREAVSRALLNLIDNAIKYSDDDRAIEVVLRRSDFDVILEVKDHGIGIEPKELERIFDPYYRAQFSDTQTRRGAGLGLTLVQQIVASHGGRVEVESEPGRGSTFRLLFPIAQASDPHLAAGLLEVPEAF